MGSNPVENIIVAELIKKSLTVYLFQKLAAMLTIVLLWTDRVLNQFNSVRS
jgi:hypothetical protein